MNLNEEIAKIKYPGTIMENFASGAILIRRGAVASIINYQNDWNYLGPLVLELSAVGWKYEVNDYLAHQWSKVGDMTFTDFHFGTATCMAWLKEFNN